MKSPTLLALAAAACIAAPASVTAEEYLNVYGNELQPCSQNGMARTGYTRTGYCVDRNDDAGSHHICIDVSTSTGGNFCEVTGQSDWCSAWGACNEDSSQDCQIQNWCVCQWAFASYLQYAGGCSKIQDIVCDSINIHAVRAYAAAAGAKYRNALDCLASRCDLDLSNESLYGVVASASGGQVRTLVFIVALAAAAVFGGVLWYRSRKAQEQQNNLGQKLVPQSADQHLA